MAHHMNGHANGRLTKKRKPEREESTVQLNFDVTNGTRRGNLIVETEDGTKLGVAVSHKQLLALQESWVDKAIFARGIYYTVARVPPTSQPGKDVYASVARLLGVSRASAGRLCMIGEALYPMSSLELALLKGVEPTEKELMELARWSGVGQGHALIDMIRRGFKTMRDVLGWARDHLRPAPTCVASPDTDAAA